jgi:hypothetical protein
MNSFLDKVDDQTAEDLLRTVVSKRSELELVRNWELEQAFATALGKAFGIEPQAQKPLASALAREALAVLSEDPTERAAIQEALLELLQPKRGTKQKYGHEIASSVTIVVAAIGVLQTRIRIERNEDGKWTFLFDKRETNTSLLKPLAQKLLDFLSHAN